MYVVMTKVKLREGTSQDCAELFRRSNRQIVEGEPDWCGAQMIFDSKVNEVTVLATWKNVDAYKRLRADPKFGKVMSAFSTFFASEPQVSVHEILVDMAPAS